MGSSVSVSLTDVNSCLSFGMLGVWYKRGLANTGPPSDLAVCKSAKTKINKPKKANIQYWNHSKGYIAKTGHLETESLENC